MWGFSKKRFLVTLGLSILVWAVTNFIQLFNSNYWPSFSLLGGSCTVTGYPVAFCLASYEKVKILFVYLINISFWFLMLHFGWKWFGKAQK